MGRSRNGQRYVFECDYAAQWLDYAAQRQRPPLVVRSGARGRARLVAELLRLRARRNRPAQLIIDHDQGDERLRAKKLGRLLLARVRFESALLRARTSAVTVRRERTLRHSGKASLLARTSSRAPRSPPHASAPHGPSSPDGMAASPSRAGKRGARGSDCSAATGGA